MLDFFIDCFVLLLPLVSQFLSLVGCGLVVILLKRFMFRGD